MWVWASPLHVRIAKQQAVVSGKFGGDKTLDLDIFDAPAAKRLDPSVESEVRQSAVPPSCCVCARFL